LENGNSTRGNHQGERRFVTADAGLETVSQSTFDQGDENLSAESHPPEKNRSTEKCARQQQGGKRQPFLSADEVDHAGILAQNGQNETPDLTSSLAI
jgi:hypothetical protein